MVQINEYSLFGYFFGNEKKPVLTIGERPPGEGMLDLNVLFIDDLVFLANSNKKTLQYFKVISEEGVLVVFAFLYSNHLEN